MSSPCKTQFSFKNSSAVKSRQKYEYNRFIQPEEIDTVTFEDINIEGDSD